MADYTGYKYRIRAGRPFPITGGSFVWHTFMAEKRQIDISLVMEASDIAKATDFKGQGGDLESATYERLNDKSGTKYRGTEVHFPEYVDEDVLGV